MKQYDWGDAILLAGAILFVFSCVGESYAATDSRICTTQETVVRDKNGKIKRSMSLLRDYQSIHPCPSTGKTTDSCPGWALDHVIPLACGGCDSIENLQWLPNEIKSAAGKYPKDRWERKINCKPMQIIKE